MSKEFPISEETYQQIERYLQDALSDEELIDFERKLVEDTEFNAVTEQMRSILIGIESVALKEQMNEFHKELKGNQQQEGVVDLYPKSKDSNQPSSNRFWQYAAAVVAILLVGSWWFSRPTKSERIFSQYFIPDPGLPTTMGTEDDYDFLNGMVSYKQGEYDRAIELWEPLKASRASDTLSYFLGISYLAQGELEAADTNLTEVANITDSAFNKEAMYYLGLKYLSEDKPERAREYLRLSGDPRAEQILSEWDE